MPSPQRIRSVTPRAVPANYLSLFPEFGKERYLDAVRRENGRCLNQLSKIIRTSGVVLYLGTGVSRSVGLPNWLELVNSLTALVAIKDLTLRVRTRDQIPIERALLTVLSGKNVIKRCISELSRKQSKPILMMTRVIKDQLASKTRRMLAHKLYHSLSKAGGNRSPRSSALINSIVRLTTRSVRSRGIKAIVNYNYDDLADANLRRYGIKCKTLSSGADSVLAGHIPCYHVHGVIPFRSYPGRLSQDDLTKPLVFSEDEYHEEYVNAFKWSNIVQLSMMSRRTGLFIGLSMEDPNIRRLLDRTHKECPGIINYAILTRKRSLKQRRDGQRSVVSNLFEQIDTESFKKIGVRIIWADTHEEVPTIIDSIRC